MTYSLSNFIRGSLLAASLFSPFAKADSVKPVDATAAPETKALLENLHKIGWETDTLLFGQEFPLSYDRKMTGILDSTTSDVKDVVGDHPGIHGLDFHFFLDKDLHEVRAHYLAAHAAYEAGAVVTFDYHWLGKYGGTHRWHEKDAEILYNVVHGDDSNGDVTWFYQSLDEVLKIVNEDLGFPIVFRPLHEMNGNWFWWGSKLKGGPEVYQRAFQLLVEYMSERSEYLLFSWSPDKSLALDYYPGKDFVDVIGIDGYGPGNPRVTWFTTEHMVATLEQAVDFAAKEGKVAAMTETGYDTSGVINYHETHPDWWSASILEPILASEKASRIAWVLTWVNADWSGPYTPTAESPAASKEAFQRFYEHPATLFESDAAALKLYEPAD